MDSKTVRVLVGGVVAIVAIVATFIVARLTAQIPKAELHVELDATTKKAIVKVTGGGGDSIQMQLPDILKVFLERDAGITRSTICTWGRSLGIIDANDIDSLKEFELVPTSNFWDLWNAIKSNHCATGEHVEHLSRLAAYAQAVAPVERRTMTMTWHASTEVPGNAILFQQGDLWFATRLQKQCNVVIDSRSFPAEVYGPTRLAGTNKIQVSEGTFVRIISQANGSTVIPRLRSKEWKAITDKGKVEVEVLC